MPNVEIIGFGDKTAEVRDRIRKMLRGRKLGGDAVTTAYLSAEVEECACIVPESRPYLRIFSTEFGYIEPILKGLRDYGIHEEVEVAFFPYVYFEGTDISTGEWKKAFNKKMWFWKLLHYCKLMK